MNSHNIDMKLIRPVAKISSDFCRRKSSESVGKMPARRTPSRKLPLLLMEWLSLLLANARDLTLNGCSGQCRRRLAGIDQGSLPAEIMRLKRMLGESHDDEVVKARTSVCTDEYPVI